MLQDLYAQICSAHMACWRLLEVHPCACLHAVKHWREALRNFLQTPKMTHGELGFIVHGNFSSNLGGPLGLLGTPRICGDSRGPDLGSVVAGALLKVETGDSCSGWSGGGEYRDR